MDWIFGFVEINAKRICFTGLSNRNKLSIYVDHQILTETAIVFVINDVDRILHTRFI